MSCKITISFGEILFSTSTLLGVFFVISPFRTLPRQKMAAQFPFFSEFTPKKADLVNKKVDRTWGNNKMKTKMDTKYTNSVLESGSLRVLGVPESWEIWSLKP